MLAVARKKAAGGETLSFVRACAENLPFPDGSFDVVTASFGVRTFSDTPLSLGEIRRVMKPSGTFFVLEFSTPRSRVFGALYRFYFHNILPRVGGLISKDRHAYTYLPNSVKEFPTPEKFVEMLAEAGFGTTSARPLTGGVAYIYTAKP
jgi:demethylmenaquinone methyltransferase/2-methoxy-6-polyprenyl-1,4-benzoquinol methylase